MNLRYELQVNGLDNAYIRQFGCDCPRCTARPERAANTSVSLIALSGDAVRHHVLFDAGTGVTDSLIAHPLLNASPQLDAIVLTHWHSDHTNELMRLGASWNRAKRRLGLTGSSVPVYCRDGSAAWLARTYPHLKNAGLEVRAFGHDESKGQLLEPLPQLMPDVTITPITTTHSTADIKSSAPLEQLDCCCGYLLETPDCRVALLWDLDATNTWLAAPAPHQEPTVERLRGVDHVFFDCNTWHNSTDAHGNPASHASFTLLKNFARHLEPRCTWLVHLSGHEDDVGSGFGWLNSQWQAAAQRAWTLEHLPGTVRVPQIGERIALTNLALNSVEQTS